MIPLTGYPSLPPDQMLEEAERFLAQMRLRRTVRDFSDRPVPRDILERCVLAGSTAPNGANRQPWRFVVVGDPAIKRRIREEAEKEEQAFYGGRAPQEWLDALAHLGTDEHKPFLERAPWLIVVFGESYEERADGRRLKNYYVTESVGIATGMLITALHEAGLVTLTHTPSPMKFLNEILGRPDNERPFLILVVGLSRRERHGPGDHQEVTGRHRHLPGVDSERRRIFRAARGYGEPCAAPGAATEVRGRVLSETPGAAGRASRTGHRAAPGPHATVHRRASRKRARGRARRTPRRGAPRALAGGMRGEFVALAGNRRSGGGDAASSPGT